MTDSSFLAGFLRLMTRYVPDHVRLAAIETAFGWIAVLASDKGVRQLTLGHRSEKDALAALDSTVSPRADRDASTLALLRRLRAYAEGEPIDFGDVTIDLGKLTEFRRKIVFACRRIPYGWTRTYGELSTKAGYPAAARAVGQCMARNPIPLIVPCHRVVAASGHPGGFSAPGGIQLKQKLLRLELGLPVLG
jgi:methylated-DNA-[protein]-cysteine S-methyltransferase